MGVREHDDVRVHAGWRSVGMIGELARRLHDADIRWSEKYLVRTPVHPGFWVRRRLSAAIAGAKPNARTACCSTSAVA